MASSQHTETDERAWIAQIRRSERHLSAAGMVLGFAVDNFTFGRIDHPGPHIIFVAYLAVAAISIILAHALQAAKDRQAARLAARDLRTSVIQGGPLPSGSEVDPEPERPSRLRAWLPAITRL